MSRDGEDAEAASNGDRESGGAEEAMSGKVDSHTPPTPTPLTPTPPTTPAVMTVSEADNPQGAVAAGAKAPTPGIPSVSDVSSTAYVQDSEIESKPTLFVNTGAEQKPSQEQLLQAQSQTDKSALFPHLHSQLTQMQQRTQTRKKREDQQHKFHVDETQSKQTAAASNQKNQRSSPTGDTPRSRSRRRARWKLKFHHQALPPEYLDHYEASLTRASGSPSTTSNDSSQPARIIGSRAPRTGDRKRSNTSASSTPASSAPSATPTPSTPMNVMASVPPHGIALEALVQFRALCARDEEAAAVMARLDAQVLDACKARIPEPVPAEPSRFSNKALLTTLLNNRARQAEQDASAAAMKTPLQVPPPKRAPGKVMTFQDLPYMGEMTLDNVKPRRGRKPKKADICHLIYKNYGTVLKGSEDGSPGSHPAQRKSPPGMSRTSRPADKTAVQRRLMSSLLERRLTEDLLDRSEEPLNLCLRDLNQLKIRLLQRQSGISSPPMEEKRPSSVASPFSMDIKSEPDSPSPEGVLVEVDADPAGLVGCNSDDPDGHMDDDASSYWSAPPQTPLFVHPLHLYNLGSFGALPNQNVDPSATLSPLDGSFDPESLCSRLGFNPAVSDSPGLQSDSSPDLPHLTPFALPLAKRPQPAPSLSTDNADSSGGAGALSGGVADAWTPTVTTKRKRSAIFVPTVAADSPNATTEVSICKFKFTGGERPVLQKKKMLSVDAGGNFRYYTGPSDERLFPPSQPAQPSTRCLSTTPVTQPVTPPEVPANPGSPANRKKKSKKSLAREKLEKTFKEKGFLIQTQQLESAEGATYCKFRQLRKFTRYLFRSWKDYLPGSVRDMSSAAGVAMSQEQGLQNLLPVLEEEQVTAD